MAADGTWKQPLEVKEKAIEANIQARHNILGLYPSQVEAPLDGSPVDNSTLGIGNIAHAVCWTANYLAGSSFRYAHLKKSGAPADELAAAKARADEVFEAVYRCQLVTGVPGLQARGYAIGHGESYEERWDDPTRNEWHQGVGEYSNLRWRGDPSHHNYSDSVHGLMQYWRLAAEGEQKARATAAIDALVSYWVDNDYKIHKLDRSQRAVPILGYTSGEVLDTRILMAIAGAKYAHHVTGKEKFKKVYDQLTGQTKLRSLKVFPYSKDFDDAEHCFSHLENLMRLEEDPEVLAAYRIILDTMWEATKDDGQALFSYIYAGLSPNAAGMEKPLEQALVALQTWPTDMTIKPRMNSLKASAKPPYRVYDAAWDNEYMWKGNLLQADGWFSRTVTGVAVPEEDPMVIYAIDTEGSLFQSRDGAATAAGWHVIDQTLASPVRALDAGPRARMIYVACDDGFYTSTTGGYTWKRLPVPGGGTPVDIQIDPSGAHSLYATTTQGVYRSLDYGEEYLGKSWECLTEGLPAKSAQFRVAPGDPGRVYAILDQIAFSKRLDGSPWVRGAELGIARYTKSYPWFVTDPANPDHAFTAMKADIPNFGVKSILQETTDGGMTWSNDMASLYEQFHTHGLLAVLSKLMGGEITEPVLDPRDPSILYSGKKGGFMKSADGGKTWSTSAAGLEIPWVRTVFAPRHSEWLFASTPEGLCLSKDQGKTWEPAHLVLQWQKNTRRELGGAAYIDAYWRARYYDLIDDKAATAPFEAWGLKE